MDLVSKLVPVTENLKPTAHFTFEKMDLHDGLENKKAIPRPVLCFTNVTNHCTRPHRQISMTMRIFAAASSAQRLVCDEGSPNVGGLASAHSPCYLFRVLQMRHMPQVDSRR